MNRYKTDVSKLNIQEQVQYLTDLHQAEQGMVSWGIRVIDRVDTADELDNTEKFDPSKLVWGDAVAVGTEAPFFFYIWTRTSTNPDVGYWFPFGPITTPGPQGAPGESIEGPQGKRGTKWFTNPTPPALDQDVEDGDMYLDKNGNITQAISYSNGTRAWVYVTNIKGAPGIGNPGPAPIIQSNGQYITSTNPQTGVTTNVVELEAIKGNPGETGPAGRFINIRGILPQGPLPTPTALNDLTAAYLVGTSAPYTLYIQVGETVGTAQWRDAGPFNAATAVRVGGVYQTVWDADTKLDKQTKLTTYPQVYAKYAGGGQGMYNVTSDIAILAVAQRTDNGDLLVNNVPVSPYGAVNKNYVNDNFAPKSATATINWTDRNPNATRLDPTLTGNITTGAKAEFSAVLNKQTTAFNTSSLAIGNKCIAKGDESLAGGYQSVTLDSSAVAIGEQALAAANSAVAFGNGTQALKDHSFVYGYHTKADANCALAGGNNTQALAENSVAFGANSIAEGSHSFAGGLNAHTGASTAFAYGEGVKANYLYQTAIGRYNHNIEGNLFEIGNGSDAANPVTVFSVTRDGRAKADTLPSDNNDLVNKFYADNNSTVSLRYIFESLDDGSMLCAYLTINRALYNTTEPYQYFAYKGITSPLTGIPCYCEHCGQMSSVYWDESNEIYKCVMSGVEYELINVTEM